MAMGEYEAKTAMQMSMTAMDAASRVMAAMIEALSGQTKNKQDQFVLSKFKTAVEEGQKLYTLPVDAKNAAHFEELIKPTGALLYKTESATNPGVYEYLLRSEDRQYVDETIIKLRKEGVEIMQNRRLSLDALNSMAQGKTYQASFGDSKAAAHCELRLDRLQVAHSMMSYSGGRTEIYISAESYDKVKDLPEMATYSFVDSSRKMSLQDVNQIVREGQERRDAEESRKREGKKQHGGKSRTEG